MPQPNQHMMRDQQLCDARRKNEIGKLQMLSNFIEFHCICLIQTISMELFCLPLIFSLKTMCVRNAGGARRIKTLQSTAQSAQVNQGKTKPGFYECVRVNTFLSKCSCLYIFVHVFVYFHLCVCEPWKDHVDIVVFDECLSDIEILRIVPQQNNALISHFN